MSDYEKTHLSSGFPQASVDTGRSGRGLFWVLFAIAGLGLLVLIGSFGNVSSTSEQPAVADPAVISPAEPEAGATSSTGAEATGTIAE